jgi:hypothetical protein
VDLEIVVSGSLPRPEIELAPAAFNARQVAIGQAESITEINSVSDLDEAARALTLIKSLTRSVEDSRKAVKAPVLEVGKRIDAIAKDFSSPLEGHADRLSGIIGAYQEAQKRKAEREREEYAQAQAAALAELRIKQTAAAAAGDADAADQARAEAADKIAEAQLAMIKAEGPRLDNITTRGTWKFEVTDINALFEARPDLCLIEPNNAAIRAIIKATNGRKIPGLRTWQEATAIVRSAVSLTPAQYDY